MFFHDYSLTMILFHISIFSSNNYSKVGNLQIDMPPAIGSLNVKEIMIEKNDNSEGTIEFLPDARQFTGE